MILENISVWKNISDFRVGLVGPIFIRVQHLQEMTLIAWKNERRANLWVQPYLIAENVDVIKKANDVRFN